MLCVHVCHSVVLIKWNCPEIIWIVSTEICPCSCVSVLSSVLKPFVLHVFFSRYRFIGKVKQSRSSSQHYLIHGQKSWEGQRSLDHHNWFNSQKLECADLFSTRQECVDMFILCSLFQQIAAFMSEALMSLCGMILPPKGYMANTYRYLQASIK